MQVNSQPFEIDDLLPISLIREHTKTTDIKQVSDDQLRLYRSAAIEAAEIYIGIHISKPQMHMQHVDLESPKFRNKERIRINLDYPATGGQVMIVGGQLAGNTTAMHTCKRFQKSFVMQNPGHCTVYNGSCCDPCNKAGGNSDLILSYNVGYNNVEDVESGIIVGCLKYIAWSVINSGDTPVIVNDGSSSETGGIKGTNDAVWASGAQAEWTRFKRKL